MTLRTDLFKTVDRVSTRFIAVRDTLTRLNDVELTDAKVIDEQHCRQGRVGIGYHFLILWDGIVQLCRGIDTCGNHSRGYDDTSVAIGIVGGATEEGDRAYTRTPEQERTLSELTVYLESLYPGAEVHDRPSR